MKKLIPVTLALGLSLLLPPPSRGAAQKRLDSFEATAKGEGRLVVNGDETKISAVVVVLRKGGAAEITFITEIQLLVSGKWSGGDDASKGIDLEITGGGVGGNAKGTGKLFLDEDGKRIVKLTMRAKAITGTTFEADFVAAKSDPAPR